MKKFLLPAKREVLDGGEASGSMKAPSESVAGNPNNKRASKANTTAASVAPDVIKVESDSSDSAFENGSPRVVEQKPKQGGKQKKRCIKNDELTLKPPVLDSSSTGSYPAFPADIEDAQGSLLAWCAAAALTRRFLSSCGCAGTLQTSATFHGGDRQGRMRRMVCGSLKSCCSKRESPLSWSTGTAGWQNGRPCMS